MTKTRKLVFKIYDSKKTKCKYTLKKTESKHGSNYLLFCWNLSNNYACYSEFLPYQYRPRINIPLLIISWES